MSILAPSPLVAVAKRPGTSWWAPVIVGIGWIVIGFVVLQLDSSTMSIVFGILVMLSAIGEIFRAVDTTGGWRVWHVIFAVLLLIGAAITFVNPGASFTSLALVIGFLFAGAYDIITSLFSFDPSPVWWLHLLSGIAEILLGFLASSSSFSSSVVELVTYVSVVAIFRGVAEIAAAFTAHQAADAATS